MKMIFFGYLKKKQDEVEAEMRRLRQELKQTMDLYSNACREALTAKQQVNDECLSLFTTAPTPMLETWI